MLRIPFTALALFLLTTFAGCSKNNDPEPPPGLVGTWSLRHTETNVFRVDDTEVSKSGLLPVTYLQSYVFTPSTLVIRASISSYTYDYQLSNDQLTLYPINSVFGIPFSQKVVELSKTNLILQDQRPSAQGSGYTITLLHLIRQ